MAVTGPREAAGFVLLLGTIPAAALVIPDLVLGQSHSTQSRYLTPTWLAIEVGAAYGLANLGWTLRRVKWTSTVWRRLG